MSFWVALGTVVVCGIATGIVMHAVGVIFVAGTLVARGQMLVSTAHPEDATSALATYALLAAVIEAMLVKLLALGERVNNDIGQFIWDKSAGK